MTDYGTIKIPKDEYDRHNERRKANGQTWAEYIDGQEPTNEQELPIADIREAAREGARDAIAELEGRP